MTIGYDAWEDRCIEMGLEFDRVCWRVALRYSAGLTLSPVESPCPSRLGIQQGETHSRWRGDGYQFRGDGYRGVGKGDFLHGEFFDGNGAGSGLGYGLRYTGSGVSSTWGLVRT